MSVRLSHGRAEMVCLACKGHNFLVTGQGETGKSIVVREIIRNFQAAGKRVFVVCSSGIACTILVPPLPCIPLMDQELQTYHGDSCLVG